MSEAGVKFLMGLEGWRNKQYLDSKGLPTIGVGHLITINEREKYMGKTLTTEQVKALLAADLRHVEDMLNKEIKVQVTQSQFDVLVSFAFNVGNCAFQKSTLLKVLNAGQYDKVPEQLMRWVKPVELTKRREQEVARWLLSK